MKKCFKCNKEKDLSEFYRHPQMKDGFLNKCKCCTKLDASKHRSENIDRIREYDRKRGNRQGYEYTKEFRSRYPKKYRAYNMVRYQKRAGNLHEEPCEACGSDKVVAHHDDYDKPLNVRWLCQGCHKQWHAKNGEGKNAK